MSNRRRLDYIDGFKRRPLLLQVMQDVRPAAAHTSDIRMLAPSIWLENVSSMVTTSFDT